MIISTSNVVANNTPVLTAGTISSGSLAEVLDPNFAKVISSSSTTFAFTVGGITSCKYIALHGLKLSIGVVVTITVYGDGFSDSISYTIDSNNVSNLVFRVTGVDLTNIEISVTGTGVKTISYVQAGDATVVPWGTDAGQSLYYLGYNSVNRTTSDKLGAPVIRTQNKISPKLRLNIKNVSKTWVRDDLQKIFNHYQKYGVLSILDYETDSRPNESVAGFNLENVSVKTHSDTLSLCNVSFSLQVSV